MTSNQQAIRDHYDSMARGASLEERAALLDPDIEWVEPSLPGQPPRVVHGRDAVVNEVWQSFGDGFDDVAIHVEEVVDAGETIVALGSFRGHTVDDRAFEISFVHVWKMRDGRAVYMRTHADTAAYMAARGLFNPALLPDDPSQA